jgi:hypothetical protein
MTWRGGWMFLEEEVDHYFVRVSKAIGVGKKRILKRTTKRKYLKSINDSAHSNPNLSQQSNSDKNLTQPQLKFHIQKNFPNQFSISISADVSNIIVNWER